MVANTALYQDYERNSEYSQTDCHLICLNFRYMHLSVALLLCGVRRTQDLSSYNIAGRRFRPQRRRKNVKMNHEQVRKSLTGSLESIVAAQMQEMEMVRQKVFSLEQAQLNMKQRYDSAFLR